MLPAAHRLRTSEQFRAVLRAAGRRAGAARGARAGGELLVLHLAQTDPEGTRVPRVGFVVSAAVGGAVVRNRTVRRLRHLVRDRIALLPAGHDLVVRAQPAAAGANSAALGGELDRLLALVAGRVR